MGRAGCIIAQDIEKALHVRLVAPLEYRINVNKKKYNITYEEARKLVEETDLKRKQFMKFFKGDNPTKKFLI